MLNRVTVDAAFYVVDSGIVALTAEQARARAHNLKVVKAGKDGAGEYEVRSQIQFKKGESFGYSGQVGKNGKLTDRDAEELRRMEQAESVEKAAKAARASALRQAREEYEAKFAELHAENAKLREQLAAAAKQ